MVSVASILTIVLASTVGFFALGVTNVRAASGQTLVPAGTHVHAASCLQAPPQSVKDRATYTAAELASYGLPPRIPGEPFSKWAKIVRAAGRRVCDYTVSNQQFTSELASWNWAGNKADESTPGQVYTEADMDYFVSCINPTPPYHNQPAVYGAWIGLGGENRTATLIQAGTAGFQQYANGWYTTYYAFVEDTGGLDTDVHYVFPVNCNDHMYVSVWDSGSSGCMYIQRISDGENSGDQCYGPSSSEHQGEAIVEFNRENPNFANFGSETFYGVGITDNGGYYGVNNLPHDYNNMHSCSPNPSKYPTCVTYGRYIATTGPIQYDPGDVPYDQYAVNWVDPY